MSSFNYCIFIGRVGIDPQLNRTNEGVSYCRFRLAVDQGKKKPYLTMVRLIMRRLAKAAEAAREEAQQAHAA